MDTRTLGHLYSKLFPLLSRAACTCNYEWPLAFRSNYELTLKLWNPSRKQENKLRVFGLETVLNFQDLLFIKSVSDLLKHQ